MNANIIERTKLMTQSEFQKVIDRQLDYCRQLLVEKGKEYAPNSKWEGSLVEEEDGQMAFVTENTADRLGQFKKAAGLTDDTPKKALFGMFVKHIISLTEMCVSGKKFETFKWEEKITDSINYLLLLRALIEEENHGQN